MSFEIDKTKWSVSSQRTSSHYDEKACYYENIGRRCSKCEQSFIFSAEEQKISYEQHHKYVWWLPSLCPTCYMAWEALNTEIKVCNATWNSQKKELANNRVFLEHWRYLLKEIHTYSRKGSSPSNVTMINKLLAQLP